MSAIRGVADFSSSPNLAWVRGAAAHLGALAFPSDHCCFVGDSETAAEFGDSVPQFGHLAISADVRLHNREDLIRTLGIEPPAGKRYPDCQLLLAAYEKWGEECGTFLLGEFAFAIWDNRTRRLFCCRDQIGFRPFLYWKSGPRILFASDPRSILAVPGVPLRLNARKLAGTVSHLGHHFYPEDTFHAGIMSLPAGSWMTVDSAGVRQRTYWEPEIRPELVPERPEEAFEALRDLLFKAVECRLEDEPVVAELSGGLDSSAVTAIASRCLERSGRTLVAVSAVLDESRRMDSADEREFIDEFRSWPNIRIEYVTAQGRGPFDGIEDPSRFMVSPLRFPRSYLFEAFERAAISAGAQVVLQGIMGELGPTCAGDRYFTELAAGFRWPTLIRELRHIRTIHHRSPIRFLAGRFRDLLPSLPGKRRKPYVLLTAGFRRGGEALQQFECCSPDQRDYQAAMIRLYLRTTGGRTGHLPDGKIRVSQPWLDKRVLEFCLAAPPSLKFRNGYSRYLIRGSLDGVLPRKIQWRTDKKPFSPDYFARYNAQLGKARDFVAAIGPADPVRSVIDVGRLAALLQPVPPGVRSQVARAVVPLNIYSICFLRQFAEFRP